MTQRNSTDKLRSAEQFNSQLVESDQPQLKGATRFDDESFEIEQVQAPVPVKTARSYSLLTRSLLVLIPVAAIWQWVDIVLSAWQSSGVKGGLYSLLTLVAVLVLGRLLLNEWRLWQRLARNRRWRSSAVRIEHSVQFGEARPLCKSIADSLPDTVSHRAALASWETSLIPEHSDYEQIELFEKIVLRGIDQQAQKIIRRAAVDTSFAVAVIPFALADMLLVLWRSSRMLRELTQLYGGSVGQFRSMLMLKRLLAALLWAGGSELALDMTSDVIGSEITGRLSTRAGQGVIAGLLVARVGYLAQQQLRPLPLAQKQKLNITQLAKSLVERLT